MPRINRIRVINFSYNNDNRHILDETFNFHGGENALLNLANGGGKSVLVQLFLQPLVPGARIQGRNIASFFRRKKLPAYILIEWKLDGAGGYLLTGMGMVSVEAPDDTEERKRVRYFTFTTQYTGTDDFDIAHIPLVERRGSVLDVRPFREARKMMAEKKRRDPLNFGYFTEDDRSQYARHLAHFGISQAEWRNVIIKINDNEGGLKEVFQKCKNSSQLLNDWIIKTVEKTMFKNRSEARRLEEMLENLVREVMDNERFVVEKQLLDGFLEKFREQSGALERLLERLEEQKQLAGKLSALHSYLAAEIGVLQNKYEDNEREIEACKAEKQRVQLEERSRDYLLRKVEYEEALQRLTAIEEMTKETDAALQDAKERSKVMQAAGLAEEISQNRSELSGIEEKLSASREQLDTDGRVRSLEYSLKILLEKALECISAELARLRGERADKERQLGQARDDLQAADREKSRADQEKGRLEGSKERFEIDERKVRQKLGITLIRNLLGELDAAETEKIRTELQNRRDGLLKKGEQLEEEKSAGAARRQEIDDERKELQEACSDEKTALHGINRDIQEYEQKEQEIKGVLDKYGLDFDRRFDRERLATDLGKIILDIEERMDDAARVRDGAMESIASLRKGRLHTPKELASLLESLDIHYETGESYLRSQTEDLRKRLLANNPVLPYTFLIPESDIQRVAQAVEGMTMRRVIPMIAYEDLGATVACDGRMARTQGGIALACLYEGRVFDSESMKELEAELELKRDRALEQYNHFNEAYQVAVADRTLCEKFNYAPSYQIDLERKRKSSEKRLQEMKDRISALENEKKRLIEREKKLELDLESLREALRRAREDVDVFAAFLESEPDYQDCLGKLTAVEKRIDVLDAKKKELGDSREALQKEIQEFEQGIRQNKKEQREAREKYSLYQGAPEAEIVEGSTAELEKRLNSLKEAYSGEIGLLDERKKSLAAERDKKKRELKKLGLEEKAHAGVVYDEQVLERIGEEIIDLEKLLKDRQQEEKTAAEGKGAAVSALNSALQEVKRLGVEAPLPPEEVKGDFGARRKRAHVRERELDDKNKEILGCLNEYRRISGEIRQLVDVSAEEPEKSFLPEPDVSAQAAEFMKAFGSLGEENRCAVDSIRNKYVLLRGDYRENNVNIDEIFKGLDLLWEKAGIEYDGIYFLYERMAMHGEKLTELIRIYEGQLANLQQNKSDMVWQCFQHGLRVFEEIQWISDHSKVNIQGKNRPVQMLKIDMQYDSQEAAKQRMQEYVDECIAKVEEETRQGKRDDEVRKTVNKMMASRELLNVFLGNSRIPVSVFKIELNIQNSRLKPWEDAVHENSGAEKFVVFFSVLSALMAYTRSRTMDAVGADPDQDTRVLIMDNPFGPISSEHLLNPLFAIAKKHRTQLICLSDLKQNSIMNCFNLIYMLKVRTSAIGSDEYLKFEKIIRDNDAIQNDERLEKAVFRAEVQQFGLFD
ncbi:MAG: hypothetical protein PHV50_05610 [Syntrophaceticus sp.]|nr:hypothetical protein [Syntrophaceticus sp.]